MKQFGTNGSRKWIPCFALPVLLALWLGGTALQAQGSGLPLGNPAYHTLDRLLIKTDVDASFHSSLKYYLRGDVATYAMQVDTAAASDRLSELDRWDLDYIYLDNNEWLGDARLAVPLGRRRALSFDQSQIEAAQADPRYRYSEKPWFNFFYKTPANFYEVNEPAFYLRANPLVQLRYANILDDDQPFFFNQRGLRLRAGIDDRIHFFFQLEETQLRFPNYLNQYVAQNQAVPGAGFFKDYQSDVFKIENGYDFLNGQGYLAFSLTPHVGAQFGYGQNFIGNGYRSLLLSNFANNYLYLKLNWRVWKFHYQNIFAEMTAGSNRSLPEVELLPKKYMAAHHLSLNIGKNVNVGIFETVVFTRNNQFELQYLNPIMFYRTIEQAVGSPDNVLLGLDAHWNLLNRVQIYGQLILDEFKFDELVRRGRDWWGNKFGTQIGLKYIDAFNVDHLDLQFEFNRVRPYTYTHRDSSASYTHYNQSLAHPLGANLREYLAVAKWRPLPKLFVEAKVIRAAQGQDPEGLNYGADLLLPHTSRVRGVGVVLLQGIRTDIDIMRLDVRYMLKHNLYLEAQVFNRRQRSAEDPSRNLDTQYFGLGLRWNVAEREWNF